MANVIQALKQTELCGRQFTVYGTSEKPLFRAKDVAEIIKHRNVSHLLSLVDDDEKGVTEYVNPGGKQQVWFLTEDGLYEVLMQSRKPIAKDFKRGVKNILKEIRKSGGYMVAKSDETPEQIMARALLVANETISRQKALVEKAESKALLLQSQNEALVEQNTAIQESMQRQMPSVRFAQAVMTSEQSILVGDLARLLKQNGVDIGQNRLFAWLRENKYIISRKGESYNMPTQTALDRGLFEIKKTVVSKPNGSSFVTTTPKVTGKGQVFFVNKFIYTQEQANNNESKKGE